MVVLTVGVVIVELGAGAGLAVLDGAAVVDGAALLGVALLGVAVGVAPEGW